MKSPAQNAGLFFLYGSLIVHGRPAMGEIRLHISEQ